MHDSGDRNLVSIIIPCYNAEEYVGEAIESALNQTYEPKEVVVIDDGSTDNSLDVIRSFSEHIIWSSQDNKGAPAARNYGINVSSGVFVKFLDSDDLLFKDAIALQVDQAARLSSKKSIVFGDAHYVDGDNKLIYKTEFPPIDNYNNELEYILECIPQTSLPLHRRKHLQVVGGFKDGLPWEQEHDLNIRLHLAGFHFCYKPADISILRRHGGSNRISNHCHFREDPEGQLARIQEREQMIRKKWREELSEGVRWSLAQNYWAGGRVMLQINRGELAKRYFELAQQLHPRCKYNKGASLGYRICVQLLGPISAERIGAWVRELKGS